MTEQQAIAAAQVEANATGIDLMVYHDPMTREDGQTEAEAYQFGPFNGWRLLSANGKPVKVVKPN